MADLDRLLNPKSLAVIGGKECERVIEQCDKLGFQGEIWPVHPKRDQIRGRPCLRSVEDLPAAPDAAYVAVNRERTIGVVEQLSAIGAGGAVCYAAGFAEADAENAGSGELQRQLIRAAGDMPIIGPNCYGFINAVEKVALWPDQHGALACDEGVAILTQSSNIAINLTMQKRGLPVAYVMTVGNQAQQGLSALGRAMLEDDRVTALGLHIEGLDDVKAFEGLANRSRALGKPIVAIKVGKSEQAQAATMTHTASLSGSDTAHNALFQRLGIARVNSLEEFLETLKLLHVVGPLNGSELLSMSCSGGEASLMADAAEGRAVHYRPYETSEAAAVKEVLGDIVTVANPLDYNTFIWGDWPAMIRMFEAAMAPDFDLSMLVIDFPRDDRCDPFDWDKSTDCFVAAVKQLSANAAVVASMPECMPERVAEHLIKQRIAPLCGLDAAVAAAEAAASIGRVWRDPQPEALLAPSAGGPAEIQMLDENASKAELRSAGLVVPKSVVVQENDNVAKAVSQLEFPLAAKVLGVAHKSDVGGVKLQLKSADEVSLAIKELSPLSDRFLVEEMAVPPLAELIIGVSRDPVVGLMLTIGAGGVLTELLDDTATLLLPATADEISAALKSLKIGRLLDGYRDSDAADIDALIANIVCIANYATRNEETLEELDVNPLFATQFGSVAVDALIVKRKVS